MTKRKRALFLIIAGIFIFLGVLSIYFKGEEIDEEKMDQNQEESAEKASESNFGLLNGSFEEDTL